MLTITSKLQLDYMQKQKHDLEFEMTVNTNYMNMYTDMLGLVVSDCEKEGYTAEEAKDTPIFSVCKQKLPIDPETSTWPAVPL